MSKSSFSAGVIAVLVLAGLSASPSMSDSAAPVPPFEAHVDMKTFMEHVLTPAAQIV